MPTIRAFIFIALIVASGFTLIHHHPPTHEDLLISKNENQKKIVNRNPSSLQKSSILESYEFKRHVKAMLNSEKSSKTFADLQFFGRRKTPKVWSSLGAQLGCELFDFRAHVNLKTGISEIAI